MRDEFDLPTRSDARQIVDGVREAIDDNRNAMRKETEERQLRLEEGLHRLFRSYSDEWNLSHREVRIASWLSFVVLCLILWRVW